MLTLFEVLSFKGWLEIRDVFASTFEAVIIPQYHFQNSKPKLDYQISGGRCLHPHICIFGMYHWVEALRWRCYRKLFRE